MHPQACGSFTVRGFKPASGCGSVLVDEAAEQIVAFDRRHSRSSGCVSRFRRDERQRAMWPLRVVLGGVGAEHALELAAPDDQQPVQALRTQRTDEALRVGVRLWRPESASGSP